MHYKSELFSAHSLPTSIGTIDATNSISFVYTGLASSWNPRPTLASSLDIVLHYTKFVNH